MGQDRAPDRVDSKKLQNYCTAYHLYSYLTGSARDARVRKI